MYIRWEKFVQPLLLDFKAFVLGFVTGKQDDGGFLYSEMISQRFYDRRVCFAIQRGSRHIDMNHSQQIFFNPWLFGIRVGDDGNVHLILL